MSDDVAADLRRLAELVEADRAEAALALADRLEASGVDSPTIAAARANAWTTIARAWRAGGDREAALDAARRVTELAPAWAEGWFELATDYKALGRFAEAIDAVARCVKLEPNQGDGWYNLACYRCLAGEVAGALEALSLAVQLDPSNARSAVEDDDFASIRNDERFIAIVA
ncbi:MAG TPA: tetratricopeptide repeat protein [Kofleriaceae bacterium]